MSLRMRRLILIPFLFAATSVLFTNCGGFQKQGESSDATTAEFNGGGHSGKVTYLHTNIDTNACASPTQSLEISNGQTHAFTYGCNGTTEDPFDVSQLITFDFDPNFLIFNDHIYARDTLLVMQSNEQAKFTLYCASEDDDVSFAMKTSQFSTATGPLERTYGYLLKNGVLASEEGRFRDANAAGEKPFDPASGSYQFVLGVHTSPTRASGKLVFKPSGDSVSLDCFTKDALNSNN